MIYWLDRGSLAFDWRTLGMSTRIYLTGGIVVEHRGQIVAREAGFRGRQDRQTFAYLVCERNHPVSRYELSALIWPSGPAPAWESGLSAIISRLRTVLAAAQDPVIGLASGSARYQMSLPPDVWVDIEAAAGAVDTADGALRRGDHRAAFGPATVGLSISRRPFLPDIETLWAEAMRGKLSRMRLRALDCLAHVWLASGEPHLAVEAAMEALSLDPLRETTHRLLIEAHASAGNRPEALRSYHRLRARLADELGADPSPETEQLYMRLLT